MIEPALEAIGIHKRFGDVVALEGAALTVHTNSFHALMGENGAGKSTLVKCIMGYHPADDGQIQVFGRERVIRNPRAALALGIGMVYQHFTLVPNMSVLENLVLARPKLPVRIDWDAEHEALAERMRGMPFQLPLDAAVNDLAAGQRQKLEILKQLLLDARILILDEPTSVLTPQEADEVLSLLRGMTRDGRLTVLIITHKFREVLGYADEATVLRRGRPAGHARVADTDEHRLAAMMVGEAWTRAPIERAMRAPGAPRLEVDALRVNAATGVPVIDGLDLRVNGGEIVGIAGVSGNGQRELVQTLAGQRRPDGGEIRVAGERFHGARREMQRHGMHCLPEEPLRNACVGGMSVAENIALRHFDQPPFSRFGLLVRGAMRAAARAVIADFRVRTPGPGTPIRALSGGNVQRAVLGRELSNGARVLILTNPCFGLDFGAAADVHQRIMAARNRGVAVLLVSEDLDEVLELSDRVSVMARGRIVFETTPQQADRTTIGRHMAGH